jgi:two-component system sensor histidine kinase CssS
MRDFSLGFKLWLLFLCFVIPCIIMLSFSFKLVLDYTRDQEIYSKINQAQSALEKQNLSGTVVNPESYNVSFSVYHIGIVDRKVKYMTFPNTQFKGLITPIIEQLGNSFSKQSKTYQTYNIVSDGYKIYYVIRKNANDGVISFLIDVPLDGVYHNAFWVIVGFTAVAVVLAVFFSLLFLRNMSKPLKKLEKLVSRMAEGDLETPIELDRNDEIGRLSKQIDATRKQLSKRDLLRQSSIQYISHELKTPVMTISSYAQSIRDKIYPRGSLESSMDVITSQAERLEQLVEKLLTITKLDYLESKLQKMETFDIAELIEEISLHISAYRNDIEINLDLENIKIYAIKDQISVMLENLLENAFRYAKSTVKVSVTVRGNKARLSVYNDGAEVDEETIPEMFDIFKKGKKGVSGLGLSIVKRVCDNCDADISVSNINDGVEFVVEFKLVASDKH